MMAKVEIKLSVITTMTEQELSRFLIDILNDYQGTTYRVVIDKLLISTQGLNPIRPAD